MIEQIDQGNGSYFAVLNPRSAEEGMILITLTLWKLRLQP